jgi:hypothetical protein
MDLGGWLRSLGLEQCEAAFRENAIDAKVLPDLTDQDRDVSLVARLFPPVLDLRAPYARNRNLSLS